MFWSIESLSLGPQSHDVIAVVTLVNGSHGLEQRKYVEPFDIVTRRMLGSLRQSGTVMIVQMHMLGFYWR
jgi:hypothetical protein